MSSSNSDMEKSTEIVEKDSSDMVFDLDLSLGSNISLTAHDGSASSIEHSTYLVSALHCRSNFSGLGPGPRYQFSRFSHLPTQKSCHSFSY